MLSSTYHFWGVHNLYQAKSAKLNIGEQSKVGLFFFFLFSLFVFHLSFFVFRFSLFDFVIHFQFWSFTFCIRFSFFSFRFSFFWHSKSGPVSYFDIQTEAEYTIFTFKILFSHSNWGRISNFDIQNPILNFKIIPNIVFWHSKSHFDIQTGAEYRILTFKILFWHLNWGHLLILTFKILLTFKLRPNIIFWRSKSYSEIQNQAEYRILTFKILFWHMNWGGISYFDIQIPILTIKLRPNIVFRDSKSYFDIRAETEYRNWHSKSYYGIGNPAEYHTLTFKILFRQSNLAEYQILTLKILFWHSK